MHIDNWIKEYGNGVQIGKDVKFDEPPKIERKFVPRSIYKTTFPKVYTNNLYWHLAKIFGVKTVHDAFRRYRIGERSQRDVSFWYLNESEQWLHDVIIPYQSSGKRLKSLDKNSWRTCTTANGYTGRGLFGQHLLKGYRGEVCVVESEKTALIMSLADTKSRLWLATGGSNKTAHIREGWKLFPDFDKAGSFWECIGCDNRNKPGCIIKRENGKRTKEWGCEFQSGDLVHWFEGLEVANGDDVGDWILNNFKK